MKRSVALDPDSVHTSASPSTRGRTGQMQQKRAQTIEMKAFCVIVGALALTGLSCAVAPDPGEFTVVPRDSGSNVGLGGEGGGIVDPGGEGGTGSADSGSTPDPIFGFTTYAAGAAATTASTITNHAAGGPTAAAPRGQDCMTCHATNGKKFLFAGTIYKNAAGTEFQGAGIEVRVINNMGNQIGSSAYTDRDGNFWLAQGALTIPAGSKVGVRNATSVKDMTGAIGAGGTVACSNAACHGPTNVAYLP